MFDIKLEPEGPSFEARPDETILEAALRQGVLLPYGCRNGACGACRARIASGEVRFDEHDADAAGAILRGLTERERRDGWTLLCRARPASDVRVAARVNPDGSAVRTLPARIDERRALAPDVMELRLRLPPTERLHYRPGQYIDLLLRDGRRRAFSIANAPTDDGHLTLHIRHIAGGAFSGPLFSGELAKGALLRIRGPLGAFHLREAAASDGAALPPALLIAGGTGFAPIKAMIENALRLPLEREMHLYWGVRSTPDLYLPDLPRVWAGAHARFHFVPVLSEPDSVALAGATGAAAADAWTGRTGLVHRAVLADFPRFDAHEVYVSGPPPLVAAVREEFPERGLDPERLFFDSFDPAHETGHDG